jgi:tRNA-2-methylthio-N6-dimethylallyladenosine synthase
MQTGITLRKNEGEVGTVREVLVEGSSKTSNGQLTGKTSQNRIINFEGPNDLTGLIVPVKIETAFSLYLKGTPLLPME